MLGLKFIYDVLKINVFIASCAVVTQLAMT